MYVPRLVDPGMEVVVATDEVSTKDLRFTAFSSTFKHSASKIHMCIIHWYTRYNSTMQIILCNKDA